ncbi:ABC transporter B family member 11 [Glycine soja]
MEFKVIGRGACEQKDSSSIEMEGDISVNGDPNINNNHDSKKRDDKDEPAKTVPLYKLFSFADPLDLLLMFVGTVGAIGNGISMPLMTLIFGSLINAFGESSNTDEVVDEVSKVSLKFVYLAVGTFFAAFLQLTCWMITGNRQAARIRGLYLKTILRQDVSFFDKETSTGEVVGRMSGDTVLIQDAMGEKVGQFIQLVATFFGGFVVAFIKGWLLTVVMLSCIPLLALSGAMITVIISKASSEGQAAYSTAAIVVEQTIGSIRTVASFTGERPAIAKYNQSLTKAYKTGVQEALASGLGFGVLYFVLMCSYGLAVWFGAKMVIEKGYTGGEVVTIIFAVLTGSFSIGQASPSLSAFAAGQAAAFKMFETIKRKPEIDAYGTTGLKINDIRGDIELKEVCFSYPTRPDELVFNGFSLSIPSGTTAALVGQSGSGKSTVVSLIERFYDPQSGAVLIDGINLREFQLKWIRQKIGLVSQEPVLFTCSIKENIAYGKDGATDEEIRAAAELANAAKFIDKLPQGLDTMVGEHGTQLSGGQKQRVAIARAILKDPRILLLDEATSALDAESERIVQEALDRIMINRTTVIVAHRLSTIRNADTIAVIHQGKIVERGSHAELTKDPDGAYSQLIRLQEIKRSEKNVDNRDKSGSIGHSGRHSSKRSSFLRSISQESLGVGNSGRHSFSASFRVPTSVGFIEAATGEGPQDPPPTAPSPPEVPLYRLASLNKPEIPVLVMGTVAAVLTGVILPVFSILLTKMISIFYEPHHELRKDSKVWAIVFVGLGAVSLLVYPGRFYFFGVAGSKLIQRIRKMCFEKVVHMEVSWFDEAEHSSGAIGSRLSTDAASIRALVGDALGLLVQNIATAIAALIIAFESSWQLALIILALVPLLGLNGYVQLKFLKGFSADTKKLYEEASQVANDAVGSIRTVASFCAEEKVMELYQEKCEGPIKTGKRQGIISGISFGVSFFMLYAVYATSFYAGARLVEDGKSSFSDVFRVFFALSMAALGISQSGSLVPDSTKAKGAAASIFAILDRKSEIDPSDDSGMTLEEVKGEIELRHVSFKYPTRPDVQIFRDLSLTIHTGKTVALVGESGCGKSTVISLLQRFYDPDSGHIILDGKEIQSLQVRWLRQQMGLVSQEPVLFNDTIRANIAYGKGDATEAEIIAAAELANAHRFISSLQKNPKILLLDEATSALDAESEKVVQDALDRVMVDRTTIVVAHRLSTIKGADLIAVVKNGVIAEKGKHEALLDKGGDYASLVALHTKVACWVITGERQAARIRGLYLKAILRQDISFFDKDTNSGEVVGRMSGDTVLIQEAMGEKVGKFIQYVACFFGGTVIAFIKGWLLSLALLSSLPLLVLSGSVMSFAFAKMASRGQTAYSEAATVVERTIGSIRTVASFTGEKQAIAQYNQYLIKAYRVGVQEGVAGGFGFGLVRLFIYCTYALAVWFGGKMVLEKGYTGGQVISIFFAVLTGSMSLGQASPSLTAFAAGQAAAFKMFETIKRQPDIDAYDTGGRLLDDISGDIELKEVCFSYPSRPDEQIFNGFSISIPSGTTAALVGQSGSGKSTVISLIERFYDPQAGEVLIDGINLREFQLKWIRQKIGLVSQEPVLFACSIKENIAYGKDGATDEEIRAAAELANAAKFIDKFPHGLDTMVGEHGIQLSGGQKQRISIARAILKDPRILLLDEATSALDAESERVVQETLDRIMINRTTVIVAHRLSTIRNADVIAVIHHGKVIEKGTHAELTKDPDGAFSQLIRLQKIKRESDQYDANESGKPENFVDSERQLSQRLSFPQSFSLESSGRGIDSQRSFKISNAMPTSPDLFETSEGGPEVLPSAASNKPQEVSLLRIAYLNKPEIPVLLLGTVAAAATGAILPTVGLLLSHMINTFFEPADELRKDSKFWALIFVVLSVAAFIFIPLRSYLFAVAGSKLIKRIRLMCFEKIIQMEIGWFDKAENSSGALGARLSTDAASIRTLVGDALGLLVQDISTAITALVIAFDANWQLSLIVLVLVPLVLLNGNLQMKSMQGFSTNAKKLYEEASQVASDAVGNIRTVAAFGAEEKVMELYQKKCVGPIQTGIRQGLVSGTGFGLSLFFLFSVYACSFYAGARLVESGKTSISDVFRVFFALSMAAIAMSQSGFMTPAASKAKSSAASVFAILDQKSRIDPSDESGMTLEEVNGEIRFHHVTFKYPTRPNVLIFKDLSLNIHAGETIALVGESGSGKSSVISLLQRFYDPDSGQITLDGTEIQKLRIKWFRQQMGLVSQEPVLFNDTIRANIAYGKGDDATETEIIAAAELANAHKFISSLQQVSLKFALLGAISFLAAFLQVACWVSTGERQAARIRGLYLKAVLRQDISYFDKETNTGEVVERMSGDTVLIQEAMGEKVGKFIQCVACFLGGLVIAFIKGWFLTLVLLSCIPPLVLSGSIMSIAFAKLASRGQAAYSEAATVAACAIGSIRTVASFTGENQAIAQYNQSLTKAYRTAVQDGVAAGLGLGSIRFFITSSFALALWFGAKMVLEKGYTPGQVMSIFLALFYASMSLGQVSTNLTAFAAGQAAAFKIFETINRHPDIDAYDTAGQQKDDISGDIELREVFFSYPSRPDALIFNGFSISISSGTNAALVGKSGSGKSTVISLIERFYDPQAGEVLIDGINLRELQLKWIRQKIGLVSQEPVLFHCSIKENIAYGKDGATDEEIRAATELANAAKFIDKFPHGLDTVAGEHGTQLSGGQKQRIAIARAILKDPRVLLLDEATSALDAESERVVQETLDKVMINRTTIIVAHRLNTIRNADTISVIHQGRVVENGTHAELIKDPDGAYSQLIRLQEINKQLDGTDDSGRVENSVDSERQSSQWFPFPQSLSLGSSGTGNSSHDSFRISNAMPTTLDLLKTSEEGPEVLPPVVSHSPPEVSFLHLVYLNKPEIPELVLGTLAAIVTGAILPLMGFLISNMINTFLEPADELRKVSKFWALMFIALGVAGTIFHPIRSYFFAVAGSKLIKRIGLMCFKKIIHMEVGWFDKAGNSSGILGARLSLDVASIRTFVGDALGLMVQDVATVIIALVIAFEANWQLSLIILVLLPLLLVNGQVQMGSMQGFATDAKKLYEEASQVANDAVGNIRTIAAFCAEEKVMNLYQKKCLGPIKTGIWQGIVSGTSFGLSLFLVFSVNSCSFYAGARLVENGKTSISDVFRVFFTLTMAAIAISQSGFMAPGASKAKSSVTSIFAILDQKSRIDPSDECGMTLQEVKGEIEFHHVTFKYPTRPNVLLFRDLSLTIHAGETVALAGESGSGKSTVISLLQRFYEPDSGQITLDGTEIQKLQLKWFRQQMGLVSQEPVLFNDTIRTNIAYGKGGDATEAEIIAAAELANAHTFISSLQQGYDTIVGERGIQLSGGQKQRVAIARAIVKNPKILLLDEATSALDVESERVVQDALDQVMVDRTTIVVAHRLSTIKDADSIAVVQNGVIAEQGKHDTLLNKGGIYASLVGLHTNLVSS